MPKPSLPAETAAAARKRTCFFAAPIGPEGSETRKKSDLVLKHLVKKALEPNYEVERADDIKRPGVITVQIVQQVFDADLVVADLSELNPNVYYELAIRHATKKPAVHIISAGQEIPFDVQQMRVVHYDLTNPDSLEEARGKLREYAGAIEQGETVVTPVQFAQILQSLKADEDRDKQLLALFESLTLGISNLQVGMGELLQDLREQRKQVWQIRPGSSLNVPLSVLAIQTELGLSEKAKAQKAEAVKRAKEAKDKE